MQTSTPLVPTTARKSFHNIRKSIQLQDITNSPSSSAQKRVSYVINQSLTTLTEVDDELERSQRRNEAELQKRLSRLSGINTPQSPQIGDEKAIQDHVQICLKMYAENKINVKNAWNLKIIDYMRTVLNSKGVTKDSLQVASTSLDVSTKIYGIRVDDIYAEGLKLASSMARVSAQKESEATEDDNEDDYVEDGDQNKPAAKKKKKRMFSGQKLTLAKDPSSLLSDVVKLESVFFQTRTNLESSSIDNLFTNKLPMNHARYKFMLMNKDRAWASYDNKDPKVEFEKTYPYTINHGKSLEIGGPFAHFEIDEWDPDNEDTSSIEKPLFNEEVVFDAQGIPIPELDGSIPDLFADAGAAEQYASSEEECERVGHDAVVTNQVAHIVDFKPQENGLCANEYSYASTLNHTGSKLITQVWAGPSHWKLKHVRRTTSRFSGQQQQVKLVCKSAKRTKIQPTLIDFHNEVPGFDRSKIYKTKRYRIDEAPVKCTLPEVFHDQHHLYQSLMLKPVFIVDRKVPDVNAEDPEVRPYNYENPNDSFYCSQNIDNGDDGGHLDDDRGDGDCDANEENPVLPQQNFLGDNLVDAPQLVPQTYIPYALQAKKMDMRKLKTAVWKSLICDQPHEQIIDQDMYKHEVHRRKFSNVYKQLPNRISEKMQKELSCPLAFVALLHLANEQNLKITTHDDLKDLTIEQTKHFTP